MMTDRKGDIFGSELSQIYEIRVHAYLEPATVEWLGDLTMRYSGDAETVLTGLLPDQSALFGVLLRLHNLGIPLISVNPLSLGDDPPKAE